jgi:hypothetical protein
LLGTKPYDQEQVLQDIIAFLQESPNRAIYSVTDEGALDGLRCTSKKHGGFDDEGEASLESVIYILSQN